MTADWAQTVRAIWEALATDAWVRAIVVALGGSLILGLGVGAVRLNSAANLDVRDDAWVLPQPTRSTGGTLPVEDFVMRFWSERPLEPAKKADDKAAPKPAGTWRLVGTVDQGAKLVAVIEVGANKLQRLGAGDGLPDGAKIVEIADGRIVIERDNATQTVRLFPESTAP